LPSNLSHPELSRWLAGVASIAEAVNAPGPVEALLDRVAQTACHLMNYDFCGVFLPNSEGDALVIKGASGLSRSYIDRVNADHPVRLISNEPGEAPSSRAFLSGHAIAIADITTEPLFRPWGGVAKEQGYRSMVSVPLKTADAIVGTINCYRADVHHFDGRELELLATLANQAAIAIGTARLRELETRRIGELQGLNSSLEAQHTVLQKAEAIHKGMTSVALRAEGVQGVARALSALINLPLIIDDPQGNIIAASEGVDVDDLPTALTLERNPSLVTPGDSALLELRGPGSARSLPVVVASVRLAGLVVARIWIPTRLSDLGPLDARAIEHATVVTALELLREGTATEVEWRLRGSLMADLLSSDDAISEPTRTRAKRLGHDLSAPHVIMVGSAGREAGASSDAPSPLENALKTVTRFAANLDPLPLVAIRHGYLVVLWPSSTTANRRNAGLTKDVKSAAAHIRELIAETTAAKNGTVAVSHPCDSPTHYASAFRVARGAVELARRGDNPNRTVNLDELGIDSLLLQIDDPQQLLKFADRVLAPLHEYDRLRKTELVMTLRTYLENDLQLASTAHALHVHTNTVGQRVRRIQGLLDIRLTHPTDLLNVTAALAVAKIAGYQLNE
jgi:sugar diacid utilization regulator/GAF domain-containing protein